MDNGTNFRKYEHNKNCPVEVFEEITISVPFTVRAFAEVEDVEFECLGCKVIRQPRGRYENENGNGNENGSGNKNKGVSKFTIQEKIKLEIPVKFVAECDVGESEVDFDLSECKSCGKGECDDED